MSYTIKFTHPDFDKDAEFELTGVGLVTNGKEFKMDADAERAFVSRNGVSVKDYFQGSEMVNVSGTSELKADEVKALTPTEPTAAEDVTPPTSDEGGET